MVRVIEKAMTHFRRMDPAGVPAADAVEPSARTGHTADARDPQGPVTSFAVEGVVLEVLAGFGLAHVRAADGSTYGLTKSTPGILFADLHEGQRVRVEVTRRFSRVMHAQLLGD